MSHKCAFSRSKNTKKGKGIQYRMKESNKLYRCPKFGGDAKQTLEIRVERKRNLKLGELGEVNFRIF